MVISNIIGGLGNQMFQFAAGRGVSLRHHTPLALDISGFSNYTLHQGFELARVFSGIFNVCDEADIRQVLGWWSAKSVRRIFSHLPSFITKGSELALEPHFHYWPGVEHLSSDCYLSGYWQSERYFGDCESQIRADFSFKQPPVGLNAVVAEAIRQCNSVSLHVRRGDYVSNPHTLATHGLCPPSYYEAAIRYMSERVGDAHLFVFSDDMDWVKNSIEINLPHTYVHHNHGSDSHNDMMLMSMCQHHIIANSSFSWWGAWLNPKAGKIVVAPKRWFVNQRNVEDLIPVGWVKL